MSMFRKQEAGVMRQLTTRLTRIFLGLWLFGFSGVYSALGSALDNQIEAFENAANQNEGQVANILKTGISEGRSAEAFIKVKPWLTQNPGQSASLLYYAGQAAERSGEWTDAVSYYRKLLKNKNQNAQLAAYVVPAVYRLMIADLRNPDAAYLFMREEGDRLRVYGKARQYDEWYLEQAQQRQDVPGVAKRLAVMAVDGSVDKTRLDSRYEWLCSKLESFKFENETWYEATDVLARVGQVPAPYRARLSWASAVVKYNRELDKARNAKKPAPTSLFRAPQAAAAQLLNALPDKGALLVAQGWGHEYDHGHSGNCQKRFDVDGDKKKAQLLAHLPKMSPEKKDDLLGYRIAQGRVKFEPKKLRQLVLQHKGMLNSLTASSVELYDKDMTVEEARALAPELAKNPHGQAALIRVIASGQKKFTAAAAVMMKSEAWRYKSANDALSTIWHSGYFDREGVDFKKTVKQHEKMGPEYQALKKQFRKGASTQERMAGFKTLYGNLAGGAPSIPSAMPLWEECFATATEEESVSMFKALVTKSDKEHTLLLKRALEKATYSKHRRTMYWSAAVNGHYDRHNRPHTQKGAAALMPVLEGQLKAQASAGKISSVHYGMWLHNCDPKKPESAATMKALLATPAYKKLSYGYRHATAHKDRFGKMARTADMPEAKRSAILSELMAVKEEDPSAKLLAALKAVLPKVAKAPSVMTVGPIYPFERIKPEGAEMEKLTLALFRDYSPMTSYPSRQGYEPLARELIKLHHARKEWDKLVPYAAGLWRSVSGKDHHVAEVPTVFAKFAEAAYEDGQFSVAYSIAKIGVQSGYAREQEGLLKSIIGKASSELGAVEIPVDETDPTYAIYKSHAEFIKGNLDTAYALYEGSADQLQPIFRKLTVAYSFWLISKDIEADQLSRAEQLVKDLTVWSREVAGTFSPSQEADLKISYADLAFRKGKLSTAKAWYRKVADAAEYKGSESHLSAALGSVTVDRVGKNFGAAITELDKLIVIMKKPEQRTRIHYTRAEVLMDQTNFKEALDSVNIVLRQFPKHPDARILLGKIQYQMRKLTEASEIELGPSQDETVIVPGEAVKINLRDPTLSVSGVGADIEVEIWAKSGDRERILLHQFGDTKERFRAEVRTAVGAPVAGDKVLQILGDDEIRFGYSQRFRKMMKDLPPDPDLVISVASDAHMSLAAGAFPPKEGERKLDIEELGLSTAQKKLGTRAVRPGNPVYLRVTDPDRSVTARPDTIPVKLTASSGDVIRRLELTETGPFTGIFEGVIETSGAQALAFASESAPGRDPNMAISSKNYPGWLGEVGNKEDLRVFGVDLNDNVKLGELTLVDGETSDLTHFVVQTSMNGQDWVTRARYPGPEVVYDGNPHIASVPTYRNGIQLAPIGKDGKLPDAWRQGLSVLTARASVNYQENNIKGLSEKLPIVNTGHPGYSGLIRIRLLFYQEALALRRFRLDGYPLADGKKTFPTFFLLDGKPAANFEEEPLYIERELRPGLHMIEIWRHEGRDTMEKRKPVIMQNVAGKSELEPCPDSMFDPTTFPEGVQARLPKPASITKAEDGSFKVAFGEGTRGRVVRIGILGFSGVAPEIKTVRLTDAESTALLPVQQDFMALRENKQLEVLPGDNITAEYEDAVSATPKRTKHAKSLKVAFNNAQLIASFLNYEEDKDGTRVFVPEAIRRFRFDDPIAIVVDDADMDGSRERDVLDVKVRTSEGSEIIVKAVETEAQSGRFMARVFPVEGKPSRSSEIQLPPGGTITAVYLDSENLNPGIATERTVTFEHAIYSDPQLSAYTVSSRALPEPKPQATKKPDPAKKTKASSRARKSEVVRPRFALNYSHVEDAGADLNGIIGSSIAFDIVSPHLALAGSSEIKAYVQTESARKKAGKQAGEPFDIMVPGTLKLTGRLGGAGGKTSGGEYIVENGPVPPRNISNLEEGRFRFAVPLILGDPPERSYATKQAESLPSSSIPEGVAVQENDVIHVAYAFKDENDEVQWRRTRFNVGSHVVLDVMNGDYSDALTEVYVGERIFARVIARGKDVSADRDRLMITLTGSNGAKAPFELRETDAHSGIFKGAFRVRYADEDIKPDLPPVALNGFPVVYGDTVTVSYQAGAQGNLSGDVSINKGANGYIEPFSKRFGDSETAVMTGFTLAECFFELAKKHKKMEQESLARREIAHARKLLSEAIASHEDQTMKAHAEYLLGNLSHEFADLSKNDESKTPMYQDALARFMKIPNDYPETEFASKAQFKIGYVLEKMGEVDDSVNEYVKLAYKYPDDELIPSVMARIGKHFQAKGQVHIDEAKPLRENEDEKSLAEVLRLEELAYPEFMKAAMVYSKLNSRFPDDPLAGLSGLSAGQNYMRAHQFKDAVRMFTHVDEQEQYDGPNIRAQAIYWMGLSLERSPATLHADGNQQRAYKLYRRITFEFPDSKWAKYARGRLADPAFERIILEEEKQRERLLEALKYEKINRQQQKKQQEVMDKLLNK